MDFIAFLFTSFLKICQWAGVLCYTPFHSRGPPHPFLHLWSRLALKSFFLFQLGVNPSCLSWANSLRLAPLPSSTSTQPSCTQLLFAAPAWECPLSWPGSVQSWPQLWEENWYSFTLRSGYVKLG